MSSQKIKTSVLKQWCNATLSPLAWQRVTLKASNVLFDHGMEFDHINNPSDEDWLHGEALFAVLSSIQEIYGSEVPDDVYISSYTG